MTNDDLSKGTIILKSPDGQKTYLLLGTLSYNDNEKDVTLDISCIESYTLTGGPGIPFEYITLKIPKKKLIDISSDFKEPNAIIAGKSRLDVDYYGKCMNMCVTKCTSSNNYITIVAYHECEILRGLTSDTDTACTPIEGIQLILHKLDTFLNYEKKYSSPDHSLVLCYDNGLDSLINGVVVIPAGTNLWTALQILAYTIGCKVFFAGNFVYIVDFTLPLVNYTSATLPYPCDLKELELYTNDVNKPLYENIVDTPSYGEEGFDTVKNSVVIEGYPLTVTVNDEESGGTKVVSLNSIPVTDVNSVNMYGLRQGGTINTSFLSLEYCGLFGQAYLRYLSQPQQSITFTVKEVDEYLRKRRWREAFPILTRVCLISNNYDDVSTNNLDNLDNPQPQKQFMDYYERKYPEGASTYTFGVMESISLSQSTSSILTALSSQTNYI